MKQAKPPQDPLYLLQSKLSAAHKRSSLYIIKAKLSLLFVIAVIRAIGVACSYCERSELDRA